MQTCSIGGTKIPSPLFQFSAKIFLFSLLPKWILGFTMILIAVKALPVSQPNIRNAEILLSNI